MMNMKKDEDEEEKRDRSRNGMNARMYGILMLCCRS